MHIIQELIGVPKIKTDQLSDNHVVFTMGPLPTGYGMTLGNALRRVLLSSLPGSAVTGIKIEGVSHEYSTIPGVKDSVLDFILNLKQLYIKKTSTEASILKLETSKKGEIKAKDIQCPSEVEILNGDLYLTTLDKGGKLNVEIRVEKGVGYVPANKKEKAETDTAMIVTDASYTPVKKVRFEIEATRVGDMTDLDKLILEIETDGTLVPEEALKFASNILKSYFNLFNEENVLVEEDYMSDIHSISEKEKEQETKPAQESYTPIEILGFSPRTLNALINGGIGSIEQLSKCTESKLSNLRGFGKKALTEVREALEKKGLTLSED